MSDRIISANIHAEPSELSWTFTTGTAKCACREWTVAVYNSLGKCKFCSQRLSLVTVEE